MKILLHIGQSKTGTSAIQAFLTLNRERLKEHRILYPAVRSNGMTLNLGAHNAVADSLLDFIRFPHLTADQYFQQFFDDAEKINANLMILSAEHFFGGEPRIWDVTNEAEYFERYYKKIRRLAEYLKGHEVSVLAYLRPQVDWMSSAVSQTVRIEGLISERRIYKNDRQFYQLMRPRLKYADLLDAWRDGIAPSTFIVIPYVRDTLYGQSSISDFLKRTGLDHIKFDYANEKMKVNESISPELIEVKKRLNIFPKSKNKERTIIRCLENLSRINPKACDYVLSPDVRDDIKALASEQNTRISRDYITDEVSLVASSKTYESCKRVSDSEIKDALELFETEFKRPKYFLLYWNYALRAIIRDHAKPIQALMHQGKAFYWAVKYKH